MCARGLTHAISIKPACHGRRRRARNAAGWKFREALDPLYLYPILNLARNARYMGRPLEALALLDEALDLVEPDAPAALFHRIHALADLVRLDAPPAAASLW